MNWATIGIALLLIVLFLITMRSVARVEEGFTTVDLPTVTAQRQQLQWEGERRYNSLARLQAPKALISPAQIQAAVQQVVPVPTTHASAQQTLLGTVIVGAQDDGTNKAGQGVEQTGMVAEKIKFCESLKSLDCSQLNDPRLAECGICLDGGKNSKGKFHRGGMYISSDDQIRAGEVASANGMPAIYAPTVGTCPPANFVLMQENCVAREAQLACLKTAAPTSTNQCAQCYGSGASYKGTLFVGQKPATYTAILNLSHPGLHQYNGVGTVITKSDGTTITVPAVFNNQFLLNPQQVQVEVTEGDQFTITVYGMPLVWCAWLSSPDGKRTVSLDIGVQSISPANGAIIAGDKNSTPVQQATSEYDSEIWSTFQSQVPNTVLWYQRNNNVVPPSVTVASYGFGEQINWVGWTVKGAAAAGSQLTVSPNTFGSDPAPGTTKQLITWTDVGNGPALLDGATFNGANYSNAITFSVTVPATLLGPTYPDDLPACPAGPMVFTEIGAGLMGSHSCFKPDGSFNPTQYCLAELFTAAGGTQQGTAYPNSATAAAALVQNDSTGKPSLDATVAYLNNQASIAQYGVDSTGKDATWAEFTAASMAMLGTAPTNPCDGPRVNTGPYSPECLDYLYRTSGTTQYDGASVDPTTLPYAFCSAKGTAAPLNADGTPNAANVAAANQQGNMSAIRAYYQNIFNTTQNSSDFYAQAAAMESCYNSIIQPPPETAAACPPPNPDEWHCVAQPDIQPPEVFYVGPGGGYNATQAQAESVCTQFGARLATSAELANAQSQGADWCATGWLSDSQTPAYPSTYNLQSGCGNGAPGVKQYMPPSQTAGVNCFGVKPPQGASPDIYPFGQTWNAPNVSNGGVANGQIAWDDANGGVPAFRVNPSGVQGWNGQGPAGLQCLSSDNATCAIFPDKDTCVAWTQNPSSNPAYNGAVAVTSTEWSPLASVIDTYIRQQV